MLLKFPGSLLSTPHVAESDYQAEVIIFTAKDMAEADGLPARRQTQDNCPSTVADQLFLRTPTNASTKRNIGESFARTDYAKQVAELDRPLVRQIIQVIAAVLENSAVIIDEAQEQAFSAGHSKLVENLEKVRGQLSDISAKLAADGEQAGAQRKLLARFAIRSGCRTQCHRRLAAGPAPQP